MEQQQHQPPTTATSSAAAQLSEPPPPPSSQQQQPSSTAAPPSSPAAPVHSSPNPNPNSNQNLPTTLSHQPLSSPSPSPSQPRPSTFARPWQQTSHFPHFSSHLSSLPPSSAASSGPSLSTSVSPPVSASAPPRGSMTGGVPASPSPQPAPFSSSFGQQFGGLGRNVPEQPSNSSSNSSQVRPQMQGMGVMGSISASSQMRPAHHQQRPVQSSLRPQSSPSNQSPASQNFQGNGLLRGSSAGSLGSPSPSTSQGMQFINQPWLSSGAPHGKPPLPSPSYRAQINSQSLQQRSHIPQQQQHYPPPRSITQQLQLSSSQAQQPSPPPPNQPQDHYGQQVAPSRVPQSSPHQQQTARVQGSGIQKPPSLATMQPTAVHSGTLNRTASAENDESGNRILSKRSIHELVSQIDPLEKLDPDVEDILVDIAEDFIDSITTFGCSLAKHRKSNMLEAKDILLHLERNWNMSLPGFGGDEIKSYRKPPTNDIHRERLSVIKRLVTSNETINSKNSAGQGTGNAKGNLAKTPANTFGSPNVKIREAT